MPPRTSSRRRAPVAAAAPTTSHSDTYMKRAVMYHASMITVLWVTVFFFALGMGLTLLVNGLRLDALEASQQEMASQLVAANAALGEAKMQLEILRPTVPTSQLPGTSSTSTPGTSAAPAGQQGLVRGSTSPDGTKYAGYEDVVKGKLGISVVVLGEARARRIVLFNTKTESSGAGTADESTMSVRWTNNNTIEYDVLVKQADGKMVKEVQTVEIYF